VDDETEGWDDDQDGWTERQGDCDDGNAHAYPGAPESLDGRDGDCDTVSELAEGWCGGSWAVIGVVLAFGGRRRKA
jgi:hypothetical protein